VARNISANTLPLTAPLDDVLSTMSTGLSQLKEGFLGAMRAVLEKQDEQQKRKFQLFAFDISRLYLTPAEKELLIQRLGKLFKPYKTRRGVQGEQEIVTSLLMCPQVTSSSPVGASIQNGVTVGAVSFNRAALEQVLAEGKRLRINVVGLCHFAQDVPADLADRTIERLQLVGELEASPAVRAVLQQKRVTK
jgi:hypothetical protein